MTTDPTTPQPTGRDPRSGRFARGNKAASGNPIGRRQRALREALDAATPEDVAQVLEALRAAAVAGDVGAAGLWLANVVGKPRERAADAAVDLGDVTTAAGIAGAFSRIATAVGSGTLEVDTARSLAQLLQQINDATVLRQIEAQLRDAQARGGIGSVANEADVATWRAMVGAIPGRELPAEPTTTTKDTEP